MHDWSNANRRFCGWFWMVIVCVAMALPGYGHDDVPRPKPTGTITLSITPSNVTPTTPNPAPSVNCKPYSTQAQAYVPQDLPYDWYWTKNGQKIPNTDKAPGITITESGTYTLGGTWQSDPNILAPNVFWLDLKEQPDAGYESVKPTICEGQSFSLTAKNIDLTNRYYWLDGQLNIVSDKALLETNIADTYSLSVVGANGCTKTQNSVSTSIITVSPRQTLTLTPDGSTTFCQGESVRLMMVGGGLNNAVWTLDGNPLTNQPNSATLVADKQGTYGLSGDPDACLLTPLASLTVGTTLTPTPVVSLSLSVPSVCQGQTYQLHAYPIVPDHQYRWVGPNGPLLDVGAVASTSLTGTFSLTTTTSPAGCTYTTSIPGATVVAAPQYTLSLKGVVSFCEGETRTLTASGGDLTNLSWTVDEKPIDPNVPADTPLQILTSGRYGLTGTLLSGCGTLPDAVTAQVGEKPAAQFETPDAIVCKGKAYKLLVKTDANANYTYRWFGPTGQPVNPANSPTFETTDEGPFTVEISTPGGCKLPLSSVGTVQEFRPITQLVLKTNSPLAICEGSSTTLAVEGGDITNYYWTQNGSLIPTSYGATSIPVSESATYTVEGAFPACTFGPTQPLKVSVTPIPVTTVVASQTLVCAGDPFTLSPRPNMADRTYQWRNAAGQVVTFPNSQTGTFSLKVTTTAPASCTYAATSAGLIEFRPVTPTPITASGPTEFCEGETRTLTAALGTNTGYNWTRNGVLIPNTTNSPTFSTTLGGTYSLTGLPVCTRPPTPVSLKVNPLPTVSIVPNTFTLCEGDRAQIVAQTTPDNTTVQWQRDGANAGSVRSLTVNAATYLSLTATTPAGCWRAATPLNYQPTTYPLPVFKLAQPDPIWQNITIRAGNAPENGTYRYQWTPTIGTTSATIARPVFSPSQTTSYTLTITDQRGCQYADVMLLTVWARVETPTAFTPNGDGANDTWQPANIDPYPNAEVHVYDRWGAVVYAAKGNEAPFDGTLRGEPLPVGTYTYRVRLNFQNVEQSGRLVLLR